MLVQPTIEVDCFPAFQNDFDAVAGLDYCSIDYQIDNDDPWNKHFGVLPQDVFDVLTQDLPGNPEIHVTSGAGGKISIELSEKRGGYYDHRAIQHNEIHAGSMIVDFKGQGVGKKIFRNYVELGTHLQLHGFIILAGDDNGAYAWAKVGVPLQEETDITNHDELRNILRDRLNAVRDFIYPEVYDEVSKLIEFNNVYDINAIADLDAVISENLYHRYNDGDVVNDDERDRLRKLLEFCADNGKEFTLGRYLLNGASYRGYLSFYDEIAMPRIEKYVGGFKTIELIFKEEPVPQRVEHRMALTA